MPLLHRPESGGQAGIFKAGRTVPRPATGMTQWSRRTPPVFTIGRCIECDPHRSTHDPPNARADRDTQASGAHGDAHHHAYRHTVHQAEHGQEQGMGA